MNLIKKILQKQTLAFIVFLFLAIILTYPAILNINTHLIGDGGDTIEYFSYLYLFQEQINNNVTPFSWTTIYRYPVGFDFEAGSDARLFVTIGGLLLPIFGDVLTYNLLILFILAFNGYISWLFFSELNHSSRIGFIGAIIYGFSYQILVRTLGHVNLMQIYALPLVALALLKIYRKGKANWKESILLSFSLLLISLATLQYFVILIACLILLTPIMLIGLPTILKNIKLNSIVNSTIKLIILLCVSLTFFLFIFPSHSHISTEKYLEKAKRVNRESWSKPATLQAYFLPNPLLKPIFEKILVQTSNIEPSLDNALFLGYVEILLAIFAIFFLPKKKSFILLFLVCLMLFFMPLGKGSLQLYFPFANLKHIWPFYLIFDWQRFFVYFYFFFTILIVLLIKHFSIHRKKLLFIAISFLLIIERASFNFPHVAALDFRGRKFEYVVQKMPGNSVLDIPMAINISQNSAYNILPFTYKKNSIQGFFNWPGRDDKTDSLLESEQFIRFNCDWQNLSEDILYENRQNMQLIKKMKEFDINTIVIHKKFFLYDECKNLRIRTALLVNDLTKEELNVDDSSYKQILLRIKQNTLSIPLKRVYTDDQAIIYQLH